MQLLEGSIKKVIESVVFRISFSEMVYNRNSIVLFKIK